MINGLKCGVWQISLMIIAILGGCDSRNDYCSQMEATIADAEVAKYLIRWVDDNIKVSYTDQDGLRGAGGMWPGNVYLEAEFDWQKLNMTESGQVRLIGHLSAKEGVILENVSAVYFGDRTRKGIIVKVASDGDFGVSSDYIRSPSGRIAVVCRE